MPLTFAQEAPVAMLPLQRFSFGVLRHCLEDPATPECLAATCACKYSVSYTHVSQCKPTSSHLGGAWYAGPHQSPSIHKPACTKLVSHLIFPLRANRHGMWPHSTPGKARHCPFYFTILRDDLLMPSQLSTRNEIRFQQDSVNPTDSEMHGMGEILLGDVCRSSASPRRTSTMLRQTGTGTA